MYDPIVAEVRRIREQLASECNYDLGVLLEKEREFLKTWKGKKVSYEELMAERESVPRVAETGGRYGKD